MHTISHIAYSLGSPTSIFFYYCIIRSMKGWIVFAFLVDYQLDVAGFPSRFGLGLVRFFWA